jgi:endothelin-converting enzyme/putative endopeptidase
MRFLAVLALGSALIGSGFAETAAPAGKPVLGSWGVETQNISKTVKPGEDFYRYVNEGWLATAQPVPGFPYNNAFTDAYLRTQVQLQALIDGILAASAAANSDEGQIAALYRSYVDVARRNELGLTPIKADLDAILAAASVDELIALTARPILPSSVMLGGVLTDDKNPTRYVVATVPGGLSLPSRDYYLAEGEAYAGARQAFVAYAAGVFTRAGIADADVKAAALLAFETKIAETHWTPTEKRDSIKSYHLMTRAELNAYAPGFPWDQYLAVAGFGEAKEVLLLQDTGTQKLAKLFAETDLETLKTHMAFHFLDAMSGSLSEEWEKASFDFYSGTLAGIKEQLSLANRAQAFLHDAIGEVLGRAYAKAYFPEASRAIMDEMVANLRTVYRKHLTEAPWMDEPTRKQALIKLEAIVSHIGFPERIRDWSGVTFDPQDLIGNRRKISEFENADAKRKLGESRRDWQWPYPAMEINAGYSTQLNSITFPAGILQSPFFDPHADIAVNYGSIGAVIGHEIGHAFDDQGSQSDETGALRNWWTDASRAEFNKRTEALVAQYNAYSPLEGMTVNGQLTLGENIADLGGVTIAYEAYQLYVAQNQGGSAPVIDGFTGDQRFFLAWGQVWRDRTTPDMARQNLLTDVHSPGEFRANGPLRNFDAWYAAFDVKEGDKMYLPPDQRVKIW